jgi:hypothetical protein
MKKEYKSEITLDHIQIKSIAKAKKLAKALNVIEIECGIEIVKINLIDSFICPDIEMNKLKKTPMERLLKRLIKSYQKSANDTL